MLAQPAPRGGAAFALIGAVVATVLIRSEDSRAITAEAAGG
jgi:hypothetical protein